MNEREIESSPPWGVDITPLTEVCGGRYVLLHEIARGDLSIVYRAKPAGAGREPLAFKLIQPRFVDDAAQVRRFRREAELLRRIEHPNVVRLLDHGTIEDGRDFAALELLKGRTLGEALATKAMTPDRTCRIVRQVARAVRAMHRVGVIHRDLQPDNILLVDSPGGERVKLLDFSGAGDVGAPARRVGEAAPRKSTGELLEEPSYRPPEQLRKRPPQASMDIYALGVIMYRMLAGEHPFARFTAEDGPPRLGAHTIRTKVFDAPEELLGLVVDCIERKPKDRPASMDEVLARIDKALLWLGVVPSELGSDDSDEDAATRPWAAADSNDEDEPRDRPREGAHRVATPEPEEDQSGRQRVDATPTPDTEERAEARESNAVVDTVAWTKPEPSADRIPTPTARARADEREEDAASERGGASRSLAVAAVQALPLWGWALLVLIFVLLGSAVWMVWTQ